MNSTPAKAESGKRLRRPPGTSRAPPQSAGPTGTGPPSLTLLEPIRELNERCLGLLVEAARGEQPDAFLLIRHNRESLLAMNAETRARAARKSFLLLDMEFANLNWWQTQVTRSARTSPLPLWRGRFPVAGARTLARATLAVAWHGLRADRHAPWRLGMLPAVATVLESLSLTELEHIAQRQYRFLRPRWEDRPGVWRHLLESASTSDYRRARDFNIRGLQLLVGELLGP